MADSEPKEACCDTWREAHQTGSDNEAYGALVYTNLGGETVIGHSLPAVRFCPWCGAHKQAVPPRQRKYDDLPLGARFRYVGHADYTWVKLENGGTGVIARWGEEVGPLQSVCSLCETEGERKAFIVEVAE